MSPTKTNTAIPENQRTHLKNIALEIADIQQVVDGSVSLASLGGRQTVLEMLSRLKQMADAASNDPVATDALMANFKEDAHQQLITLSKTIGIYGDGRCSLDDNEIQLLAMSAELYSKKAYKYLQLQSSI